MTVKFKLEIELGNDAMQDQHDIAQALSEVIHRLRKMTLFDLSSNELRGKIRDQNGNTVGSWEVSNA